jgi:hypothetical protein
LNIIYNNIPALRARRAGVESFDGVEDTFEDTVVTVVHVAFLSVFVVVAPALAFLV